MEVTKHMVEQAAGMPFLEYAIQKLEGYGFHFTSHMEWDEMCRLARIGSAFEKYWDRLDAGEELKIRALKAIHKANANKSFEEVVEILKNGT